MMPAQQEAAPDESFEALVRPLLSPAYGVAVNLLSDRTEAEDAVQEAALLALRAFDSFQRGSNFRAWFLKIVTNCCLGRHRQRKRRPPPLELDDAGDLYLFSQAGDCGLDVTGTDPAGAVLGGMTVEQVMEAIAR